MSKPAQQKTVFRGIYEFEDPSGTLIAAKVPAVGSVDLYSDTAVIVKPHQHALFIYQGQLADSLASGVHMVKTQNLPLLTRLANWKFGFQSPLRCELIYFAKQEFSGRRWGTPQPVLLKMKDFGAVPVRVFGNFNVVILDSKKFYLKLMGSRSAMTISDLEEFLQGQIVECLPHAFSSVQKLEDLSTSQNQVSMQLEKLINQEVAEYGLAIRKIQVLSALPSQEIIDAIDARTAIQVIGSQKEYLLYKAASSLGQPNDGTGNDPMQMMMGMMLGKGLLGSDYHEKEARVALPARVLCSSCQHEMDQNSKFCGQCGKRKS